MVDVLQTAEEMMSPLSQWYFGPFRLDSTDARLWHDDQSVPLTLKAFGVLHHLVTHAGQLVTKEGLLDALWPNTAVSDAALRVVIRELRKALGDTAQAPQFIATVHRLGYRFLAPVTRSDRPAEGLEASVLVSPNFLPPQGPGPGERKLVTVLCYILPNGSALGVEAGLNDLHRLIQVVSHLTAREVRRCEDMIQQLTGDGILALCAVPVAREGCDQRSATVELRLQQLLAAFGACRGVTA